MPGRGPAPKDPSERRRRNATLPMQVVADDGQMRGPALPNSLEWPAATLTWWETWRRSPQAQTFTDTDWSFLLDTAVMHAEFWLGNRALAAELRLRVAKFGATPEDRARLKIAVGEPGKSGAPIRLQTASSRDRRSRLLRAVGGDEAEA